MRVYIDHIKVQFEYHGHCVKVKVICKKMINYLFQPVTFLYMVTGHNVKVTYQGQEQIKVNVKSRSLLRRRVFYVSV